MGGGRPAIRFQLRRGRRAPDQLRPLLDRHRTDTTCRRSRCSAGTTSTRHCTWTHVARDSPSISPGPMTTHDAEAGASAGAPPLRCATAKSSPLRRSFLSGWPSWPAPSAIASRPRLAIETETGPLTKLMKAFQEALVHDLTPTTSPTCTRRPSPTACFLRASRIPHTKTADASPPTSRHQSVPEGADGDLPATSEGGTEGGRARH